MVADGRLNFAVDNISSYWKNVLAGNYTKTSANCVTVQDSACPIFV